MIMESKMATWPTEISEENKQYAKMINEAIKAGDIKVGSKFKLPNGEIIEIKKGFKENGEDWVEYNRSGGSGQQGKNENSVKQLRQFLTNWKATKTSQ